MASTRLLQIVSLLAAGLFAYLALIPGGLVVASLEPACNGPACEYSDVGGAILTATFLVACAALVATAACFVALALRPESTRAARRAITAMAVTAVTAAVAMYAIFALGDPIPAGVIALIGVVLFTFLRRRRDRAAHDPVSGNGVPNGASTNGHGPKLKRLPRI